MHPVIKVMSAEPERWFTFTELRALNATDSHSSLIGFVNRGVLMQAPDPRPENPRGKKFRFNRLPKRSGPQPLNPPIFSHGKQLALFVANPTAWITMQDLRHYLNTPAGRKSTGVNTGELVRRGYVEQGSLHGARAWRLKHLPPAGTVVSPYVPKERKPSAARPARQPGQPYQLTPDQAAYQARRREEAEARKTEKRVKELKGIQQDERLTFQRVRDLMSDQQPRTTKDIVDTLNLNLGRVRKAVNQLVHEGLLSKSDETDPVKYRMMTPALPPASPRLTPQARQVKAHLTGRADTELGLRDALSLPRPAVREALAALAALDALEWRAVGSLFIYRLKGAA